MDRKRQQSSQLDFRLKESYKESDRTHRFYLRDSAHNRQLELRLNLTSIP
ncbi:hypothetical protein [Anabaena azotica]